ncbi:Protein N-acetyltransferase, RimJ/RimL family [Micromonospora matsumotoense]|uniref:Protein N-acetyltransferase, RimJ/RimL family n=1 Tax=Micromonospora matsumotoense TaxID=121616 RepID=A0A1C5A3Z3_9ACTN|nr:GNAT family protein [Micromonospora matsumotoense]SCF39953.1 Protein N-acetyltransferase, RimJ/RimL family [Micromonospora matsumotoense]
MNVRGELVTLRAMGPDDASALWRWNHDPAVVRWMNAGYPQTEDRVRTWLTERPRNDYGDVLFGIEVTTGGQLIGLVRLHGAEAETGCAELDIYLGEQDHWGKGYGTDVMRTVCRYGFDHMRLHRITLTVVTENLAAHHVYRKVGFVDEGRLRQSFRRDGRWYDKFVMGLLADELR